MPRAPFLRCKCAASALLRAAPPLALLKLQINASSPEATVYYYNGTTTLFTSKDSGATFTITNTGLNPWNTPFFGVAVPPRGASAAGDLWVFSGWQLFHR